MASDMLLGLDEARGESKTVFGVFDKDTGKTTPIHFSDKPITIKELEDVRDYLTNKEVSWSARIKLTHKEARHMKRNLRAMLGKKPRLPRKLKKKLKTDIKLMRYEETERF